MGVSNRERRQAKQQAREQRQRERAAHAGSGTGSAGAAGGAADGVRATFQGHAARVLVAAAAHEAVRAMDTNDHEAVRRCAAALAGDPGWPGRQPPVDAALL